MATATKVISIGDSAAVVLPEDVLAKLKIEKGDTVYLSEVSGGGNPNQSPR